MRRFSSYEFFSIQHFLVGLKTIARCTRIESIKVLYYLLFERGMKTISRSQKAFIFTVHKMQNTKFFTYLLLNKCKFNYFPGKTFFSLNEHKSICKINLIIFAGK